MDNGWEKWGAHVLSELEENKAHHEKLHEGISDIKETLAEMRGESKARKWVWSVGLPLLISTVATGAALATVL